ncbi:MAG: ABC transporter substrate-binding protein [Microthrixaceae bacterium]
MAVASLMVLSACAARNKVEGADAEESQQVAQPAPASDSAPAGETFGDLESPCGEGDYTVEPDEAKGSSDTLRIGVANDRTSQIRPGLNKELWDTSVAFAAWCNAQGGIGGLEIELVDLPGDLLAVESAMTAACADTFMLVGGGFVQDNLEFSGKPNSDFHECGLADIPGFTASPEKGDSNGQVQPIPHPSVKAPGLWFRDFRELHPEEAEKVAVVWGNLPALAAIRNQAEAVIEAEGSEVVATPDYLPTGETDWTPLAQELIGSGAESFHWVGEPNMAGAFVKTLREQGWEGYPVLETNVYDQIYVDTAGVDAAQGTILRTAFHMFEEADQWPAVQQYLDILNDNVEDPKVAFLGMQSFSAWLLFATAANDCAAGNDDTLTRACILEAAAAIDGWTAGGLHSATDPGPEGGEPPQCSMLLQVNADGEFERLYPEVDGDGDAGDGFACADDATVDVPANEGLGKIGGDQPL